MTTLKAKIGLNEMGRPYTKEMKIDETKKDMIINPEEIIIIPLEEYKELLIYKGKYLGIIEKEGVNNVKNKR